MSADSAGQFVDSNILVYAHDNSAGQKRETASRLLQDLWQAKTGCLSIQVLQEFYVNITRKVTNPLTHDQALWVLRHLSAWRVHAPVANDVLEAVEVQKRYQISFWDSMVIQSAAQLECGALWSEDLNDGQIYRGVQIRSPFKG